MTSVLYNIITDWQIDTLQTPLLISICINILYIICNNSEENYLKGPLTILYYLSYDNCIKNMVNVVYNKHYCSLSIWNFNYMILQKLNNDIILDSYPMIP